MWMGTQKGHTLGHKMMRTHNQTCKSQKYVDGDMKRQNKVDRDIKRKRTYAWT